MAKRHAQGEGKTFGQWAGALFGIILPGGLIMSVFFLMAPLWTVGILVCVGLIGLFVLVQYALLRGFGALSSWLQDKKGGPGGVEG